MKKILAAALLVLVLVGGSSRVSYRVVGARGVLIQEEAEAVPPLAKAAWWMAQREARKILPDHTADIRVMPPPETRFVKGLVPSWGGMAYGTYNPEADVATIGLTGVAPEDFASMVHEYMHSIAYRLPAANKYERAKLNLYTDWEWRAGQY